MLRLAMLGPFDAQRDGTTIERAAWQTRQTVLVLKRLVQGRDRVVSTPELVDAAWPDADERAGRASLQTAIKQIRRVLEPGLPRSSLSSFIVTERDGYRFVSRGTVVDVDAFSRHRHAALAADRRADRHTMLRALVDMTALYRGDYLVDEPYADWALATRELLREQWLDAIERLAEALVAEGRPDEAIAQAERGLLSEPYREALYRSIMRAHASAGRHAHATAAFERCERVLRGGLGVDPDRETAALRDRLHASAGAGATPPRADLFPEIPFVGRIAELAALHDARRAPRDRIALVVISGPAGIGKSALVRAFADSLGQQDTLRITARESTTTVALAPIREAVESWLERGATATKVRTLGAAARTLAPLMPRLRELWPDAPASPPATAPDDLAAALAAAVRAIAGADRSLIFVEDLHWADEASLAWLARLVREAPPALVIATRRRGERRPDRTQTFLDQLRDGAGVVEVAVDPLAADDVRQLVQRTFPGIIPELADRIHAATGGDPLFVVETIRELVTRGLIYADSLGGFRVAAGGDAMLPIAGSVREIIAARIRRLDDTARDAVTVLGTTGRPERAAFLSAVVDGPTDQLLDALDGLLERQLLRPTDDGEAYEFVHPLFGTVATELQSPGRRQALHRRIADVLGGADDPGRARARAGDRLRHLMASNAPTDLIVDAALMAGGHAMADHAYADAVSAYRLAEVQLLGTGVDHTQRATIVTVREHLGDALRAHGELSQATSLYGAISSTDELPALDRARILRKLALALGGIAGRFADAFAVLDDAERCLASHDESAREERARIAAARSAAHYGLAEYGAAASAAEQALALAPATPTSDELKLEALHTLADSLGRLARYDDAERAWRRGATLARSRGDAVAEARMVGGGLASVAFYRGELRKALELARDGARVSADRSLPVERIIDLINVAAYETAMGELATGEAHLREAVARAEAIDATYSVLFGSTHLARNLAWQGDLRGARAAAQRARALGERMGSAGRIAGAYRALSLIALLEGDGLAAVDWARRTITAGERTSDGTLTRWALAELADALLLSAQPREAVAVAEQALARAREVGMVIAEGAALDALGRAQWAVGASADAAASLEAAELIRRRSEGPYHVLGTLWSRATTVLTDRPRERAAALTEARAIARRIGARLILARIDASS